MITVCPECQNVASIKRQNESQNQGAW